MRSLTHRRLCGALGGLLLALIAIGADMGLFAGEHIYHRPLEE